MTYDPRITGQIIGQLRVSQGLSQETLSGLAGIARSHLAIIENGSKSANVNTLWRISTALRIRLSYLIQIVEEHHERIAANSGY